MAGALIPRRRASPAPGQAASGLSRCGSGSRAWPGRSRWNRSQALAPRFRPASRCRRQGPRRTPPAKTLSHPSRPGGDEVTMPYPVRLAQSLDPHVVLMDLRMPVMDGVTAITELARRGVTARVLVLTTYDTDSYVLPAIEAGATGYLLKDAPSDELLRAVRAAAHGESVLAPSVAARLLSRVRSPAPEALSQRELEVLELVAAGSTNREAAVRLFISEATVKTHLLHIYAKLGVSDRAAAVAEAFNRGLLTPGTPDRSR